MTANRRQYLLDAIEAGALDHYEIVERFGVSRSLAFRLRSEALRRRTESCHADAGPIRAGRCSHESIS